jgi:hypothetical protein
MPSTKAFQRVTTLVLQVKLPTASATTSNPYPTVGGGVMKDWLGYGCGGGRQKPGPCSGKRPVGCSGGHVEGTPVVGDPPPRHYECLTTLRTLYHNKDWATFNNLDYDWIKRQVYLWTVGTWGRWITRCGGTRKRRRRTIWIIVMLQEVVSYVVKQYLKLDKLHILR